MQPNADRAQLRRAPWYRQRVLWLGALVFVASIAGCVWIIMVGIRHADAPVDTGLQTIFGVPAAAHSSKPPAPPATSP